MPQTLCGAFCKNYFIWFLHWSCKVDCSHKISVQCQNVCCFVLSPTPEHLQAALGTLKPLQSWLATQELLPPFVTKEEVGEPNLKKWRLLSHVADHILYGPNRGILRLAVLVPRWGQQNCRASDCSFKCLYTQNLLSEPLLRQPSSWE